MKHSAYKKINDERCGWIHTASTAANFSSLQENLDVDWVIVGAGFTGLSAAYRLAELRPNDSVVLLDAEKVGQGASSRNSGFIVDITLNDGGSSLAGVNTQLQKLTLNRQGLDILRRQVKDFSIECDWDESGKFHCAADKKNIAKLDRFADFLQQHDLDHHCWDAGSLQDRLGTTYYQFAVQTPTSVLVNPAALINGLVENLPKNIQVFEQSPVLKITRGDVPSFQTPHGRIKAVNAIIAVNALMPKLGFKNHYVFPLTLTASLSRTLTESEYASIGNPKPWGVLSASSMGATVRLTNDRRILVRNTVEWWPKLTMSPTNLKQRRQKNEHGLRKRFPTLHQLNFEHTWSGNVCISRNSKPVFEKVDNNLFLAGCYNAGGIAMGSLFGKLIVDYASDHQSDALSQVLNQKKPSRLPPRPFFDLGLQARLAVTRYLGRSEA